MYCRQLHATWNATRLGCPARIDAVERVEDEIGVIARRADAGDDRVEHAEIFGGNEDQFVGPLRPPDPRCGECGKARAGGCQQVSSAHDDFLPVSA
jgi:hypothetical protein